MRWSSKLLNSTILILNLGKIRIALLVSLSTATGYVLASGKINPEMIFPVTGILFLALGSGALNQYQERKKDGLMPRTASRPIPAGQITPLNALLVSISFMFVGSVILYWGTNVTALILGLLTAFWYNGVYTYLKRVTPLAVIPGSVIGALPPMIGWASVDSNIFALQPLILSLFFFIWQIPHFWLLLLKFGDDYHLAGYPSLTRMLDKNQLGRLTYMWIVATAISIILMPLFGLGSSNIIFGLLVVSSIYLIWRSRNLLKVNITNSTYMMAFKGINFFILAVMLLLSLNKLLKL
jgi:protoheme IX farnesyltransferase